MAKVVSVISTKGSVGKTALIIQFAGYLASLNKKVLIIDADSQQSLSSFFDYQGIDPDISQNGFGKFLTGKSPSHEIIKKTVQHTNIDVIVNDDPAKWLVSNFLKGSVGAVFKLALLIDPLREQYDYIFIDTEGTDGRDHDGNSVQNAVLLARPDFVLSVTKTKLQFAMEAKRVVDVYNDAVSAYEVIANTNAVPPLRFIINEHDRQSNISQILLTELREAFAVDPDFSQAELLETIVPLKRKFFDSLYAVKQFAHEYSDNNVNDKLPDVMDELMKELFPDLEKNGQ